MNSAIPFAAPHLSLCGLLAETCMLQRYLIESLGLQLLEPRLLANPEAYGMVTDLSKILHQNVSQLSEVLEPLSNSRHEMKEANSRLSGMFVGSLCKRRPREVTMMLRDDYALLNFAIMNYTTLHAHCVAMGENDSASLATSHLKFLTMISENLLTRMPSVVARERRRNHDGALKQSEPDEASAKIGWRNTTSAA